MTFDEVTEHGLSRYLENEVPTVEVQMTKSECFARALQHGHAGEHEAEASWLLFGVMNLEQEKQIKQSLPYMAPEVVASMLRGVR